MMRQLVTSHEGWVHDIAAHNRVCRAVETVAKQAVTDCNHLGNAAKMHRVGYKGLRSKQKTASGYWHKVNPEYEARRAHNQFKRKGGR